MLKLGEINIKDMYLGTTPIIRAYLGTTLVYQKAPESPLVASYRCYDKTNEDEDRAVLKDLTGNGHDITLNNFAFGGMSGYNGYDTNFYNWNSMFFGVNGGRAQGTFTKNKIVILNAKNDSSAFIYYNEPISEIHNIKITGIKEGQSIIFGTDYNGGSSILTVSQDGIYQIDWSKQSNVPCIICGFLGQCNITIELIPKYPGALVSDGVDDYGLCTNMPIFPKETGYTIIAIRKWISNAHNTAFLAKYLETNYQGEFIFEIQTNLVYNYGQQNTKLNYPELLSWQTSKEYNGQHIASGSAKSFDKNMYLFKFRQSATDYSSIALYALDIYNRDLTDEEIEEAKAKMIAEYEEKTGDLSLSLVAAWSAKGKTNDDEDRAVLKDLTGNGHDITLNNFAFSGMSGYGGYTINLLNDLTGNQLNNTTRTFNKIILNKYTRKNEIGWINKDRISNIPKLSWKVSNVKQFIDRYPDSDIKLDGLHITEDGVYTIDAKPENYINYWFSVLYTADMGDVETNPVDIGGVEIELLPEYSDALVFDGIDDYTKPIELPSNNITVISQYQPLSIWSNVASFTNYFRTSTDSGDEFIRMRDEILNQKKINYYVIDNYKLTKFDSKVEISKLTQQNSKFNIVGHDGVELSKTAWYSTYIFDRVLTEQEIKKFIRENIDPQYLLPSEIPTPDVYYDFSTGSNDDENRETIVDQSDNGNDATAHNFAWSGMSGYGGYILTNKGNYTISNVNGYQNLIYKDTKDGTRIVLHIEGIPEGAKVISRAILGVHFEAETDGTYVIENTGTVATIAVTDFTGECNIQITEEPQYPGALCFDGIDDYLQLDFPTGYKTVFINYQHDDVKGDITTKVCYDQRLENNNGKFSIESFTNTTAGQNSGQTLVNGINVMSLPNTAIPSGKRLFIQATNEGITEEDITLTKTTIGRQRWSTASCSNMKLYKFLGFKEILTEEQIHNVIQKYNLLKGIDLIE